MEPWVCTAITRSDTLNSRKSAPSDRSHNPWDEPDRRAAYGKSVRVVRGGGGWKRGLGLPHQPSTLPGFSSLLRGLTEHFIRRRLKSTEVLEGLQDLVQAVEDAVRMAGELSTMAKETVIHEHIRRCGAPEDAGPRPIRPSAPANVQSPEKSVCCEAVAAS